MAFSSAGRGGTSAEINVTPLIDVLLVLLIIFMVIVPLIPRGLDSSIPQKGPSAAAAVPPLVVQVEQAGGAGQVTYSVGQRRVSLAELRPLLQSLLETRQDQTLFIRADRSLSYRHVAEVVGEAREAGAVQVGLMGGEEMGEQEGGSRK